MLYIPAADASKKRQILMVYGMHSSLERYYTLALAMSRFGTVTVPDLPGHGGMESFYKIGETASLDNLADYLAAFIKLRYRNKRITIAGMSLGFVIATRMLQKYPELAKKVDLLVSIVGFTHKDDFKLKPVVFYGYRTAALLFTSRLGAAFFRYVLLNPWLIRSVYEIQARSHAKMKDADAAERRSRIDYEIGLWHANDVRTYMLTAYQMMSVDLTARKVDLPVHHIAVAADQYFNNAFVEQHMRCIYNDYIVHTAHLTNHAPTVLADVEEAASFLPDTLRDILNQP